MNPLPAPVRAAGALGLLLVVAGAYAAALAGPFQFDDYNVIVDNPQVHGLAAWWRSMPGIRPLLKLSYALNWALSPGAFGFHLLNLAIHVANAWLVWALGRQWLTRLAPADLPTSAAWWMALLFALHPAATEAVTYASGRSMSLMALFYLAAMWCFLAGESSRRHWLSRGVGTVLFALALGVRETAATLPLALFLLAWFGGKSPRGALRGLAPQAVLLVAALAAAAFAGYDRFLSYSLGTRGPVEQALAQAEAHAHLFVHSLLALRTNLDPDLRVPAAPELRTALVFASFAAAGVLALLSRRRWPWLGFAIAWYGLQLAPGNSVLPRFDLANDRHLYLALPGVALALVVPLLARGWRPLGQVLLLALALVMAVLTHRRNADWGSELALWQATVRDSPHKARPWANLGWARHQAGDHAGARAAWECALRLDPGHEQAAINLALSSAASTNADPGCPPEN
ncbi:hypothetical protein [Arenimonas donghaensis]|uniref:Glycosyltransferase RgtA/B/C/D-like domain-containing protein n=1 Tax=Arenimonas donghaensis DSM 18148 = HO3-R19 TaxID=1121014 RepID=A0A087MKG1_9GAMM|nr:hypothetical protein [Arenimonas donghaensis]KFL37364.1 hypothetical protein N788_10210 [Arenimonas donghaensis DSM 18148 = HO3-R19]